VRYSIERDIFNSNVPFDNTTPIDQSALEIRVSITVRRRVALF